MAKGEVNDLFTIEGELLNKDDATLLEHPNPQARRDSFLNLNGLWDYVISDKDFIDNLEYEGKIRVPYPVQIVPRGQGRAGFRKEVERGLKRGSCRPPVGVSFAFGACS